MNARRDQLTMNAFTMQGLNATAGRCGLENSAITGARHQPRCAKATGPLVRVV